MRGLIFPAASQRLMSAAAALLFVRRGVEHGEAVEVAALHVERADGERRPGVAAGHEDHAAARRQAAGRPVRSSARAAFPTRR